MKNCMQIRHAVVYLPHQKSLLSCHCIELRCEDAEMLVDAYSTYEN